MGHDDSHVADAVPPPPRRPPSKPPPPNVKQHTSPFEQLAELVHERAAPPMHCPVAVHIAVAPRPAPSCAQQTWVAASHVEVPHAMTPLLDPELLPEDDPDAPLLDPEPPLPEPPLDDDPDPPPLDPEPPDDEDPAPLLDPDPSVDASSSPVPTPGMRGVVSSSGPRAPHPIASKTAKVTSVLVGFIGGVPLSGWRAESTLRLCRDCSGFRRGKRIIRAGR
jgi:hypothetical protein